MATIRPGAIYWTGHHLPDCRFIYLCWRVGNPATLVRGPAACHFWRWPDRDSGESIESIARDHHLQRHEETSFVGRPLFLFLHFFIALCRGMILLALFAGSMMTVEADIVLTRLGTLISDKLQRHI